MMTTGLFRTFSIGSSNVDVARMYAYDSLHYTFDYPGWEGEAVGEAERKIRRIMFGQVGQMWLSDLCYANNITCKNERSLFSDPDGGYDLRIAGEAVDVKTSVIPGLFQVNADLRTKNTAHWFVFLPSHPISSGSRWKVQVRQRTFGIVPPSFLMANKFPARDFSRNIAAVLIFCCHHILLIQWSKQLHSGFNLPPSTKWSK